MFFSSSRPYMQKIDEQEKELFNQSEGTFNIQAVRNRRREDEERRQKDDESRMARAHSHRVIQAVAQISMSRRSGNIDKGGNNEVRISWTITLSITAHSLIRTLDAVLECSDICSTKSCVLFATMILTLCKRMMFFGAMRLLPKQNIYAALRMLSYGTSADQVDEITRMGKSTILESLMRFCEVIESIYTVEYLWRPTEIDLQRLLKNSEMRGFPWMISNIDCMHWTWKKSPSAWQGDYGDRKGSKSIILEAIASFDTWIWNSFFGVPGAQNVLNVLTQSLVFNDILQGKAPKVTYWVNEHKYDRAYYLADGIYPRWSTFAKMVPRLRSAKEKHFASCQERCRKDVERCFGILQTRWAIVKGAARMFDLELLRFIMMMCIILHNMIVEDKYDYDVIHEYEPDSMNNSKTQIYCAHDTTEEPAHHEQLQRDGSYNDMIIERYIAFQRPYMHNARQIDLIEHQWELKQAEDA